MSNKRKSHFSKARMILLKKFKITRDKTEIVWYNKHIEIKKQPERN